MQVDSSRAAAIIGALRSSGDEANSARSAFRHEVIFRQAGLTVRLLTAMYKTTLLQTTLVALSLPVFSTLQPHPAGDSITARTAFAKESSAVVDLNACPACADTTQGSSAGTPVTHAANCIQPLIGTWQLHDKGLRTITVKPDGTATMDVEIDNIASFIYGRRLSMDLAWTLSDGVLSYSIVGGHPDRTVGRVINNFGRDFKYRVLRMTDEAIELEDVSDPGSLYQWASVEAGDGDHG